MYPSAPQPHPPQGHPQGQPAYGQPAYGQPAHGHTAHGQPAYGQPAYGQQPHGRSAYGPPEQSPPNPARPGHDRPGHTGDSRGRGRLVTAAVAGAVAVLSGVLWLTGGLRSQPSGPDKVAPGTAIDQGRFTVTVRDARISIEKDDILDKEERFLIVRMHITNNDKESTSLFSDFLTGFTGVPKPGAYRPPNDLPPKEVVGMTSSGETSEVHPGLPVDAEARWELPAGNMPRQITVALREWEFGAGFTDLEKKWTATRTSPVIATVTLPVVGP